MNYFIKCNLHNLILYCCICLTYGCDLDGSSKPTRKRPPMQQITADSTNRPGNSNDDALDNVEKQEQASPRIKAENPSVVQDQIMVKNFRQINATMSVLTSIPSNDPQILSAFRKLDAQLPDTNDVRSFLPAHQVAIAKLSVEYCDAMINSSTAAGFVLPNVDLGKPTTEVLSASGRDEIFNLLIKRFWGQNLQNRPDNTLAMRTLNQLTDQLLANKDSNQVGLSAAVVKGICSAILASGPVILQ